MLPSNVWKICRWQYEQCSGAQPATDDSVREQNPLTTVRFVHLFPSTAAILSASSATEADPSFIALSELWLLSITSPSC